MTAAASSNAKIFSSSARKTFHHALTHLLKTEFPGIFGPAVTELFALQVEQLFQKFHPPRERVGWGQLVWLAVATDDLPGYGKRIEDTRLVPVILDLVAREDIDGLLDGRTWNDLRQARITRLCQQAHAQGGLLSQVDLGLLLTQSNSAISQVMRSQSRSSPERPLLPSRGSLHDLGQTVSHKRSICYKRLVEKKTTSQIANETFHSPQAVEQYVQDLRRVQLCRDQGLTISDTSQVTGLSTRLIEEYVKLIAEFGLPNLNETSTSTPKKTKLTNGTKHQRTKKK
jgi:uncharacterized protein DUF1670